MSTTRHHSAITASTVRAPAAPSASRAGGVGRDGARSLAFAATLSMAVGVAAARGLDASLPWHTTDGGGAMHSTGGVYSLSFTIGQPDAAPRRVYGIHSLAPGFWGAACDLQWCVGDFDLDGVVDGQDLGVLLTGWASAGPADLDGSGVVDGPDLGLLLSSWGPCF